MGPQQQTRCWLFAACDVISAVLLIVLDGRSIVGFRSDVISCELARRGMRRDAAAAESSACGRGNAVGLTSIHHQEQHSTFCSCC